MKILLIDDDEMSLELMATILEEAGYNTLLAENAIAAAEILNSTPDVALLVCDMFMPMINGIEFFRELRAQGNPQAFILLTGNDPTPLMAEEPAIDACLLKDFDLAQTLPQEVARLLARQPVTSSRTAHES